ncbi:MAG TPA: alpha-hydroxy acid oxidase [Hyphomicrobiaceae bacterium]|nr:alpha-hydroxy acid oxidase [Hyphomicrobiaceae bacterium]
MSTPFSPPLERPSGLEAEFQTQHEFIKAARMRLNPMIWDYLVGGTETETTLKRNRAALDRIALRPRVLVDVSRIDPARALLGKKLRMPILLAPVGSLESFDAGAGVTAAKAAEQYGCGMMLSSVSTLEMEAVTSAAKGGLNIYQLYVRGDDAWIDERVKRAVAAGFNAYCLTVDTAVYSRRERDIAKRFAKPWRTSVPPAGVIAQARLTWKNVAHFKKAHKIPLILKGIATAEDAKLAVEHGVDVIHVSNHGGRQLDHGRGAMDVLPEVLEVARGKAQVIVDGGFSRGTDIVKAIAMGADAVALGRLYCYALAAAGQAGVVRMLEILEAEVISAMGLIGVTKLDELGPRHLHVGAPAVMEPSVFSAFPLLNLDDEGYGGR